jgi:hypothetical protein
VARNSLTSRATAASDLEAIADRSKLFSILDASEDPPVYDKVVELGPDRALCLHGGELDEDERQNAPYLVKTDREMLSWILDEPWGRPWGIFLVAGCDVRSLRPHFRKLLVIEGTESEPLYLRYFDPRVTVNILETSSDKQLKEIFGPAQGIVVPNTATKDGCLYYLIDAI